MRELIDQLWRNGIWDGKDEADFGIDFPGPFTHVGNMFVFGFFRSKLLRNRKSYTKILWIRHLCIFTFGKIGVWSNRKARLYEFGVHRKTFAKFISKAWYAVNRIIGFIHPQKKFYESFSAIFREKCLQSIFIYNRIRKWSNILQNLF